MHLGARIANDNFMMLQVCSKISFLQRYAMVFELLSVFIFVFN